MLLIHIINKIPTYYLGHCHLYYIRYDVALILHLSFNIV